VTFIMSAVKRTVSFAQLLEAREIEVDLSPDLGCGLDLTNIMHKGKHPLICLFESRAEHIDASTGGCYNPDISISRIWHGEHPP
jgi:hypothetical protein